MPELARGESNVAELRCRSPRQIVSSVSSKMLSFGHDAYGHFTALGHDSFRIDGCHNLLQSRGNSDKKAHAHLFLRTTRGLQWKCIIIICYDRTCPLLVTMGQLDSVAQYSSGSYLLVRAWSGSVHKA